KKRTISRRARRVPLLAHVLPRCGVRVSQCGPIPRKCDRPGLARRLQTGPRMRTFTTLITGSILLAALSTAGAFECRHDSDCDDGNACTVDRCVKPGHVCRHTPVADRSVCADGNACTLLATRHAGA